MLTIKELEVKELLFKLSNCDPDYVVDVLDISSQELIDAFPQRALEHVTEEYIQSGDEEGDDDGPYVEEEWKASDEDDDADTVSEL